MSPYITECPYCGTRLRKRAPKLDAAAAEAAAAPQRPSLGRLRPGEIPGIRVDRRPVRDDRCSSSPSVLVTLGARARARGNPLDLLLYAGVDDELWRSVTTLFVYGATGYEVVDARRDLPVRLAARAPPRAAGRRCSCS